MSVDRPPPNPQEGLEDLAATPVAAPDPLFVERLESHLRLAHANVSRSTPRRRLAPALAVAAAAVVLGLAVVRVTRVESATAELEVASGVTVVLPDGTVVVDPAPGTPLADGTLVLVDEQGRAVVDGVELGPGSAVRIDRDTLVTPLAGAAAPPTTASPPPGDGPVDGGTALAPAPGPSTVPDGGGPVPAPAPGGDDPGALPGPPPHDVAPPGPPPAPPAPGSPPPPPVPVDPPAPMPGRGGGPTGPHPGPPGPHAADGIALRVRPGDTGIEVLFEFTGRTPPEVTLVLVRTVGPGPDTAEPTWPVSGATVEVARRHGGDAIRIVDPWPVDAGVVRYRVIALAGDRVLGRSAVQTVTR